MTSVRLALSVIALAALSACAGSGERRSAAGGLEVSRFHLGGVVASGEVVLEPRFASATAPDRNFASNAAAVAAELRRLGFTPGDRPGSEFIATVDIATGTPVQLQARAPARTQAAPTTPVPPGTVAQTGNQAQLYVELKRRSDGSIVWEGRAREPVRVGGTVPPATVARLAAALFRDFPGESGRTIRVR